MGSIPARGITCQLRFIIPYYIISYIIYHISYVLSYIFKRAFISERSLNEASIMKTERYFAE